MFPFHITCIQFSKYISPYSCMVGPSGLEPPTSRLSGVRSNHLSYEPILWFLRFIQFLRTSLVTFRSGGDKRDRTADPLLAKQVLSQLSYTPISLVESLGPSKLNNDYFGLPTDLGC